MLVEELRGTLKLCERLCTAPSPEVKSKQGGSFDPWRPFLSASLGKSGEGEASWSLHAVLSKVWLRKLELPTSTSNYPSTQEAHTC